MITGIYYPIEIPMGTARLVTFSIVKTDMSPYDLTSIAGLGAEFVVQEDKETNSNIMATYSTANNSVFIPTPTSGKVSVLLDSDSTGLSGIFYFKLRLTGSSNYSETVAHGLWIVEGS